MAKSLQFTTEIEINKSRDAVIELMHPDNMHLWSEHFVKMEHIAGPLWEAGSKYKIHMNINGTSLVIIETFIERNLPDYFSCSFEHKDMWQGSENWIEDLPMGRTVWRSRQTLEPINLLNKFIVFCMPWYFKSYSQKHMNAFKEFADAAKAT